MMAGMKTRRVPAIFFAMLSLWAWPVLAAPALRAAVPALPSVLDPHKAVAALDVAVAGELFVGLTLRDASGNVIPGLAENWTISADGLTYRFNLRDGLTWSDGVKLDAGTVAKSIERALDPATAAPFAALLFGIDNAEAFRLGTLQPNQTLGVAAPDRSTVEFKLAAPSQKFLNVLALPVAVPVPLHSIAKLKEHWLQPGSIVVNGPFIPAPAAMQTGLNKNPKYFASNLIPFESIDLSVYENADLADAAVHTGAVDFSWGFLPTPMPEGSRALFSLIANVSHPPLNQREVRHALGMVIDRAGLVKALNLENLVPAYSLVVSPPYSSYQAPYAKLSRADRLIVAQALLLDLEPAQNSPLRFVYPEGRINATVAERASVAWRELGFRVDLLSYPAAAYERVLLSGDFDIAVAPAWPLPPITAGLYPFGLDAGPWNIGHYREPMFEEYLAASDTEISPEYRINRLREAEGVLIEDQAAWPLFFFSAKPVGAGVFAGWPAAANAFPPLWALMPRPLGEAR